MDSLIGSELRETSGLLCTEETTMNFWQWADQHTVALVIIILIIASSISVKVGSSKKDEDEDV